VIFSFPDRDGFVELIKSGKAFVAMHSGSDTYHPFRGYVDMLGGEFETHKAQVESAAYPALIRPIRHHEASVPAWASRSSTRSTSSRPSRKPRSTALMGLDAHPNLAQLTDEEKKKEAGTETLLPHLLVQRVRRRPGLLQLPRPS
jgi:hypothetical protein